MVFLFHFGNNFAEAFKVELRGLSYRASNINFTWMDGDEGGNLHYTRCGILLATT